MMPTWYLGRVSRGQVAMGYAPEARGIVGLSDGDNAEPVPKGGAVLAVVEDGRLDLFVGVELGFYV